ncbi:MAG: ABC transporter permease [Proteobacteria bacterium]|jgi:ABC-2 type transport system permease protein|nr:ABC transporter permease [Pseudomonadota bacterium]MDA1300086.1 ABC transporter permease [Pseudomonadota bacterium]
MNRAQLELGLVFLKVFSRDRQSLILGLFLPLFLLALLGTIYERRSASVIEIGVVDLADNALSVRFIQSLQETPGFVISTGDEATLKEGIKRGDLVLVVIISSAFSDQNQGLELPVMFDGGRIALVAMAVPRLQQALVDIERDLRNSVPMFTLRLQDVQSGGAPGYLDFLLPGLLALGLMQTSLAGSAFNIVEYRRKGILKRLFVTPISAMDFVVSMCASRIILVLAQVTVVILVGVFLLGAQIDGSLVLLFLLAILGCIVFLCMGFMIAGLSGTQESVGMIGNLAILPQMFLSGVFFPIEAMPGWLQPVASLLPLTFLVNAMRDVAIDAAGIVAILPSLAGMAAWTALCLVLAARFFVWREISN